MTTDIIRTDHTISIVLNFADKSNFSSEMVVTPLLEAFYQKCVIEVCAVLLIVVFVFNILRNRFIIFFDIRLPNRNRL